MIIVISGASGFIGSALMGAFARDGHEIRPLVRRAARTSSEISWDIERGAIETGKLEGVDAVINLAGESLVQRWTGGARRRIRESRVNATSLLARTIASLTTKPRVFLSGSAVGIYGSRGDEMLDESSTRGDDFLASVCTDWESAAMAASVVGVRVVELRTGLVLSKEGGMLAKILLPFKLGVGGKLGSGRQWMSCIAMADYIALMAFCIEHETMTGPVNLVGPSPATNADFTETLGRVLHRPTLIPVPKFALQLAFGEMADDTLFASQRARPARALSAGFEFKFPTLDSALRNAI